MTQQAPYGEADGLVRVYPADVATARPTAGLVWAHGGGFAAGDLDMPEADWVARSLAERGITVISVDYALAPTPQAWADALAAAQSANDVLAANAVFMDAFYTDVRPALAEWRESRGLPADPMAAFAASGYQQKIEADRVGGVQAGWGA